MWYLIVSIPDLCTLTYFAGRTYHAVVIFMLWLICILMEFDIHIDTLSKGLATCILRDHRQNFLENDIFLSLKIRLISAR